MACKICIIFAVTEKMATAYNAWFTNVEFEAALRNSLQHFIHIAGLKLEQKLCLETVAQKRDVFGILLTGFGKSLIFQLLPRLLKNIWNLERACVLVVTPLVSIMKDQVEELKYLGLRAFAIGLGDEEGEKELVAGGFDVDLLYGSPETLCSNQWSKEMKEGQLVKQTVCLVVNEAHSVSAW